MKILVNDIAEIDADLSMEEDNYYLFKEIIGSEKRSSFIDLFSKSGPVILSNGENNFKLKLISSSYSNRGDSDIYLVTITFKEYTEEDEQEENKISMTTALYLENMYNRLRITGLQKILLEKGVVESSDEFMINNLFTDEEYDEKMKQFKKEFFDTIGYEGNEQE